jgi:hypothetical protein
VGKYVPATPDFSQPKHHRKETAMTAKPKLAHPHAVTTLVAATLATLIAIGLLTAVTVLFEHDGVPFEQVVIAEHACKNYAFVSERDACVRLFIAASHVRNVASR